PRRVLGTAAARGRAFEPLCRSPGGRRRDRPAGPRLDLDPELVLAELADAGLLADLAAGVVELRPVHVTDRGGVELVDVRGVQRERAPHADAEGVLPHRERLAGTGALTLDHDPLEDLDPLAVALDDLEVHAHGVPGLEPRHFAQLGALELLDDRAHRKTPRRA